MNFRERLEQTQTAGFAGVASLQARASDEADYHELKLRLHKRLLDKVDLGAFENLSHERVKSEIRAIIERLLGEQDVVLNASERQQIIQDIKHEVLGLGPLEPLLADTTVSEILVNGYRHVFVERFGK